MAKRVLRWIGVVLGVLIGAALVVGFIYRDRVRVVTRAVRNRDLPVDVRRGVEFRGADGAALRADLYQPRDGKARHPAIVMLHGGAWKSGSPEQVVEVAEPLAKMGFVVVAPTYRLAPGHVWPAQLEDAKSAVRWVRRSAVSLRVDPRRIGAAGFSAGAHLAALLGTSSTGAGDADVQAVIAVSGPYDLDRWAEQPDADYFAFLFGGTFRQKGRAYLDATPMRHVTPRTPPFLLVHGTEDDLVLPSNDARLAEALRRKNVPVEIIEVRNAGHVLVPVDGKTPSPTIPEVIIRAAAFLDRHLGSAR